MCADGAADFYDVRGPLSRAANIVRQSYIRTS